VRERSVKIDHFVMAITSAEAINLALCIGFRLRRRWRQVLPSPDARYSE
jgi:hypothetical protein